MDFTLTFINIFSYGIILAAPLLVFFLLAITLIGLFVGRRESWTVFDSIYWSFITATTVGYGDIRPLNKLSRILSVIIALLGLILTGIVVAVALHAATLAFNKVSDIEKVKTEVEKIKDLANQ
ncbi:MAG: potassium channel family protein [Gammaproteobacteria bacterium]|jgi:voltage-gated potassium channel